MADYQKTVEVIFGAVDNLSGSLQTIGGGVENFAGAVAGATAPLDNLADFVKTADAAIVGLGLAFGGLALTKAGEFSASVAEIGTLFGGTSEQVGQLSTSIQSYAGTSTQSIQQLNAAIYTAVSAGVSWEDSVSFIAEAERLAVAGRGDLNSTTLALTGTMNAYGASVDEAGRYSDLFMRTVQIGQTTLPELAASLSQVTATAAAAGVPFEEITAAVAALTAAGVPTSEAMTSIKAALANVIQPSKSAEEAAKALGIEFNATALASGGLSGVMQEVQRATGGNIEKMSELFGSMEGLKAATILGADASGRYKTALDGMATAAGTTQGAFEALEGTFGNVNTRLGNTLDLLLIEIGSRLQGDYADIVGELGNIFNTVTFSIRSGAFDSVFSTLAGVSDRVADFLRDVAAALPQALESLDLTKFNAGIEALTDGLAGLFDGVDLSTPEGLGQALQLVADSIGNLLATGAGIADTWGEILDAAMPLVQAFADMSTEGARTSGAVLGVGDAIAAIAPLVGSLGGALDALGLAMNTIALKSAVDMALSFDALLLKIPGATTAATLMGAALGTGGLVAAAGAAGYAVGTVLNDGINYVVDSLTGSGSLGGLIYDLVNDTDDLATSAPRAAAGVKEIGDATEYTAPKFTELAASADELDKTNAALSESERRLVQPLVEAGEAAGLLKTKTEFLAAAKLALQKPTEENTAAMYEAARAFDYTAQVAGKTEEASAVMRAEFEKFNTAAKETPKTIKDSATALEELGGSADLSSEKLADLAVKLREAEVKMAEIASNERIKNIEAQVSLDIAEVEANAQIAERILTNLSEMYEADVSLIGELTSQLGDGYSQADRFRMKMAEEASQRAGELHDAQLKVIDAQVEYMRAKTSAINAGNPVMTIQANGLEPHLEGMMWEVFKQIQIKMAQDGGDLIVGGISI